MARPKDGTFRQLCREIDPRKVADIIDGYGLTTARERWYWATAFIPELAKEGRRMKAAGEIWRRAPRAAEPVVEIAGPEVVVIEAAPVPRPRPTLVPRLVERPAAPAPSVVPIRPAPVAPAWDFPVEPDVLLRMLRRWSVRMVALTYRITQRRVREAEALAQTLTRKAA